MDTRLRRWSVVGCQQRVTNNEQRTASRVHAFIAMCTVPVHVLVL